jgi:hypothetical protein
MSRVANMRAQSRSGFAAALAVVALAALAFAPAAQAAFGFEDADVTITDVNGAPSMQAGSHPFAMETSVNLNETGGEVEGSLKDLITDLPPGLVGDPHAVPRCANTDFLTLHPVGSLLEGAPSCPDSTAVGLIAVRTEGESEAHDFAAVYNLVPAPGSAAKLGFRVLSAFTTVAVGVRPDGEHNAFGVVSNAAQIEPIAGAELTLWGNPADPAHDSQRGGCGLTPAADTCSSGITVRPFLTLPRSCRGPLVTLFEANSWQAPGTWAQETAETHDDLIPANPLGTTGCDKLGFAPQVSSHPTTEGAESGSGLDFNLDVEDDGLTDPKGLAQSDIKKAVVSLPPGVTLNPSIAEGLSTCSKADYERESVDSEPGQGCPEASKVGNVEVETPLLEGELLRGEVFVATQDDPATTEPGAENPFDSMLAIYMVIKDPGLGILVKLPGKVEANEESGSEAGQVVTTFGDAPNEIPQFPFSHFRFHFRDGARSPLVTPSRCGTYATEAVFTPWAKPDSTLSMTADFNVSKGLDGGPCPNGTSPFHPGFQAGSINNNAGAYSPFYMRLTRADGEQDLTRFDSVLPPGLLGRIAGVPKCPEAAIAAAKAKTGKAELAAPSCPAASLVGRTLAGAGVGSALTYVPGQIYLAGPFGGDPLSVVAITPALAGPFDAGTVVVRQALTLDPTTAEVQVDGAHSDPIPHMLKGIPLRLRDLRVYVDRPNFTLNPTNCDPTATKATLFGGFLDVFSSADDVAASLSSRYQAANCSRLGFKPKLSLRLTGGTRRGAHPALKAVLTPRAGDANIADAVVTLPHSAFLEQAHIRTVCTRVQFAAQSCPQGSIYGRAKAFSPLLDEPLEGPVYLRSSSNPLPDLVVALHGLFDVDLVGRIDAVNARLRSSFKSVPDAPVTRFVLEMKGGKKGLIVNSRDLCKHKSRALTDITGQNGRLWEIEPKVAAANCSKAKKARSSRSRVR